MKVLYILEDLDCAHCAKKMESKIKEVDGVQSCSINFLTQKLNLECEDDKQKAIEKEILRIVKSIEPEVTVIKK